MVLIPEPEVERLLKLTTPVPAPPNDWRLAELSKTEPLVALNAVVLLLLEIKFPPMVKSMEEETVPAAPDPELFIVRLLNIVRIGEPLILWATLDPKVVVPAVWLNCPLFVKFPFRLKFELVVKVVGGCMVKFSVITKAEVMLLEPPPDKVRFL